MEQIPQLDLNRENFSLDNGQIELCKYLLVYKGFSNLSEIINKALEEFLAVEFIKKGIEHFIDEAYLAKVEGFRVKHEKEAKENYEKQLLNRARASILEKEIELLRKQDLSKTNIKE